MRVEILNKKVEITEFTNRETGEVRKNRKQQAYLHFDGQPYPLPFVLSIDEGHDGYEKGDYVFDSTSFATDKYGKLAFAFNTPLVASSASRKVA